MDLVFFYDYGNLPYYFIVCHINIFSLFSYEAIISLVLRYVPYSSKYSKSLLNWKVMAQTCAKGTEGTFLLGLIGHSLLYAGGKS